MTSLKNKITKNFIAGILACILTFSIMVSFSISRYSQMYIDQTQDIMPEQIKSEFQYIIAQNDVDLLGQRLLEYSKKQNVDIEVTDANNGQIFRVGGRNAKDDSSLVTKKFKLISPTGDKYLGELKISFDKQTDAANQLRDNFSKSVVVSITISVAIGILIALILSTNITGPIKSFSDATVKIKDGNYDINLEDSPIMELENLQSNIKYLSMNLQNQEAVRKQYAQDISHELRTPITNMQLIIEAMKDGMLEPDEKTLNSILEEVLRLSGLVVNLNKTFQDNSQYIVINKTDFDLSEHLKTVCDNFIPRAESMNIKIETKLMDGVKIYSDKDKITQIMQNLLSNALKAIKSDGTITVVLSDHKDIIKIDVIDDGVGISKERLPLIFGRFYRIDDARNTKENGHGLGLAITKNFVESLGGSIKVTSKPDKGSKFSIVFSK